MKLIHADAKKAETAEVVVATNFIANSRSSQEALKSAHLLKSLPVNALILGDDGVGKLTLAKFILNAPIVSAKDFQGLLHALKEEDGLIIEDFHHLPQTQTFFDELEKHKTHIIATAENLSDTLKDKFFSVTIDLPPLKQRHEDVKDIAKEFIIEAKELFGIDEDIVFDEDDFFEHLEQNANSLKRYIYGLVLANSLNSDGFMKLSEGFLSKQIGEGDDYRRLLHFFDVPLIRAGFKKFGSQLSMSEEFGLNRNTLRKKINENSKFFKEE